MRTESTLSDTDSESIETLEFIEIVNDHENRVVCYPCTSVLHPALRTPGNSGLNTSLLQINSQSGVKEINHNEPAEKQIKKKKAISTSRDFTSVGGASPWWIYPNSGWSRPKSLPPLLLLRAIRPGAALSWDCFCTPGNEAIYCPYWGAGLIGQTGRGKATTTTTRDCIYRGRLSVVDVPRLQTE